MFVKGISAQRAEERRARRWAMVAREPMVHRCSICRITREGTYKETHDWWEKHIKTVKHQKRLAAHQRREARKMIVKKEVKKKATGLRIK